MARASRASRAGAFFDQHEQPIALRAKRKRSLHSPLEPHVRADHPTPARIASATRPIGRASRDRRLVVEKEAIVEQPMSSSITRRSSIEAPQSANTLLLGARRAVAGMTLTAVFHPRAAVSTGTSESSSCPAFWMCRCGRSECSGETRRETSTGSAPTSMVSSVVPADAKVHTPRRKRRRRPARK